MEFLKFRDVRSKGLEKRNKSDVVATTAKHPDSRRQISRYGKVHAQCLILGKFTSGSRTRASRIRASRSDLLKLPIQTNIDVTLPSMTKGISLMTSG